MQNNKGHCKKNKTQAAPNNYNLLVELQTPQYDSTHVVDPISCLSGKKMCRALRTSLSLYLNTPTL